jgi:hypothetical protein
VDSTSAATIFVAICDSLQGLTTLPSRLPHLLAPSKLTYMEILLPITLLAMAWFTLKARDQRE